jgi:hypothetical protein
LALDGVERQRLAVAFDGTAHRAQLAAAGKRAAQCLKPDAAVPALQQPEAERLRRIASGSADDKRKCRREIERVEADFALHVLFVVQAHRHVPTQPRT